MNIIDFDIELELEKTASNRKNLKDRAVGTLTGLIAIAFAPIQQSEELSINRSEQNYLNDIVIDKPILKQIQKFQQRSIFNLIKMKQLFTDEFISSHENKIIEHAFNLIVKYSFDILDNNDNKSVSEEEWSSFYKSIFKLDYDSLFFKWFKEINGGKSIKLEQYTKWFLNKADQLKKNPITLKTPPKEIQTKLSRYIVDNPNNYKKTYDLIFAVIDQNNDKIITKDEYIQTQLAFGTPLNKANEDANKIFDFAKQNQISEDGKIIKYDDYSKFVDAMRKPLQDIIHQSIVFLKKIQIKQQTLIKNLSISGHKIYQKTLDVLFDQLDAIQFLEIKLTHEQQKVVDHLIDTILRYEFDITDANGNNIITQDEYRSLIDSVFYLEQDRQHYYREFDAINGGRHVTRHKFKRYYKNKISNSDFLQSDPYQPIEDPQKIGKRFALLIVNSERNYELTTKFFFDIFDYNNDKVVTVNEVYNMIAVFELPADQLSAFKENLQNVFDELRDYGIGDGNKITLQEWQDFGIKMRPQILMIIRLYSFQFVGMFRPIVKY